jgi:hypothetical protein
VWEGDEAVFEATADSAQWAEEGDGRGTQQDLGARRLQRQQQEQLLGELGKVLATRRRPRGAQAEGQMQQGEEEQPGEERDGGGQPGKQEGAEEPGGGAAVVREHDPMRFGVSALQRAINEGVRRLMVEAKGGPGEVVFDSPGEP